jgi:plastocyanin
MRKMSTLFGCPARKRRTLLVVGSLSVLLVVGVLAVSCGGGTSGTTAATPATTAGPATTASTPTTVGASTTASTPTTVGASTTASTPSSTGGGGGAQVVLKNFAFNPATVTIKVGESVTWTNQDSANHTVAADKGEFQSSQLANGATFSFKFDKAGTYAYHCSIHPSMKGTVVVQ